MRYIALLFLLVSTIGWVLFMRDVCIGSVLLRKRQYELSRYQWLLAMTSLVGALFFVLSLIALAISRGTS